jgi:hypothetical protein
MSLSLPPLFRDQRSVFELKKKRRFVKRRRCPIPSPAEESFFTLTQAPPLFRPFLGISGATLAEAIEPVCENLLIPTARLEASRLIVMPLGGRQCRMTENVQDDADMLRIVGRDRGRDAISNDRLNRISYTKLHYSAATTQRRRGQPYGRRLRPAPFGVWSATIFAYCLLASMPRAKM